MFFILFVYVFIIEAWLYALTTQHQIGYCDFLHLLFTENKTVEIAHVIKPIDTGLENRKYGLAPPPVI